MDAIVARLGALPQPIKFMRERIVVHHQISPDAIEEFITCIADMKREKEAGGHPEKDAAKSGDDEGKKTEAALRRQGALGY